MATTPKSMEEVQKERLARLLQATLDVSLGTVWRLREDLWREAFAAQLVSYDQRGTRLWHPGLSLRQTPVSSLHEFVPMLFGTSGDCGPVVVRGLTGERGEDHPTSFGRILRPAKIMVREMTHAPGSDSGRHPAGVWFGRSRVSRNPEKPRLAGGELQNLRDWAKGRGLL